MTDKELGRALDHEWGADDTAPPKKKPFHLSKQIDTEKLPAFKRAKSAVRFLGPWKKLRDAVWVARAIPYHRLPPFAAKWGERLYLTHERTAYDALLDGDVMFFHGWAVRMLMIDKAAEAAGMTVSERGTILYVYGVLDGYATAAAKQLKTLGGKWPP